MIYFRPKDTQDLARRCRAWLDWLEANHQPWPTKIMISRIAYEGILASCSRIEPQTFLTIHGIPVEPR